MSGGVHMHLSYPRREDDPYPTAISLEVMHNPHRAEIVGRARMRWARRQRRRRRRAERAERQRIGAYEYFGGWDYHRLPGGGV